MTGPRLPRIDRVLTGSGPCDRGPYLLTLLLVCAPAFGLVLAFLWLIVSLMGPGPGAYEGELNRFAFGLMSALALLLWVLIGQTVRRVRSTGRPWLAIPLVFGIALPALLVPALFLIALWPGQERGADAPPPPVRFARAVRALAALLLMCALIGLPSGLTLMSAILSGALAGPTPVSAP